MNRIISDIKDERRRQDEKWGAQRNLPDTTWTTILMEEVGEAAKDVLDARPHTMTGFATRDMLRTEVVQCAAVCVAWLEDLDARQREDNKRDSAAAKSALLRSPLSRVVTVARTRDGGEQGDLLECGHLYFWRPSQYPQPEYHHCLACGLDEEIRDVARTEGAI